MFFSGETYVGENTVYIYPTLGCQDSLGAEFEYTYDESDATTFLVTVTSSGATVFQNPVYVENDSDVDFDFEMDDTETGTSFEVVFRLVDTLDCGDRYKTLTSCDTIG